MLRRQRDRPDIFQKGALIAAREPLDASANGNHSTALTSRISLRTGSAPASMRQ